MLQLSMFNTFIVILCIIFSDKPASANCQKPISKPKTDIMGLYSFFGFKGFISEIHLVWS